MQVSPAPVPPELPLTIGFAGHRSADGPAVHAALAGAFAGIAEAVRLAAATKTGAGSETIGSAHGQLLTSLGATPQLRLLCGYAMGSDRAAVARWSALQLGPVHAVFPYADPDDPQHFALTDAPGGGPDLRVPLVRRAAGQPAGFDSWTVLDGAASAAAFPPRHAHLEQSRWLVRWSDVLVVAWDGEKARGPGGTADSVEIALATGEPVIWIDTRHPEQPARLIRPEPLFRDTRSDELLAALADPQADAGLLQPFSPTALAAMLADRLCPPVGQEQAARLTYFSGDVRFGWGVNLANGIFVDLWRRWMRRLGRQIPVSVPAAAAAAAPLAPAPPLIEAAFAEADTRANRIGDIHRAAQMGLLFGSVVAVVLGTLPAVLPDQKFAMVCLELALVLILQGYFRSLSNNHTQFRWSDDRRLAERLRVLAATYPLGFDFGDGTSNPPSTWTDWYARVLRRVAGPPDGFLSSADLKRRALSLRDRADGIVSGQMAYHARTSGRFHLIEENLKGLEKFTFGVLTVLIGIFIVWYGLHWGAEQFHLEAVAHMIPAPPKLFSGLVLMGSAVIPAIAAACLGVEAKLSVLDSKKKSESLAERFRAYTEAIGDQTPVHRDIEIIRDASATMVADVDRWRDSAAQRGVAAL